QPPSVPAIDLGGVPANCVSTGDALPLPTVKHLFEQGVTWGEKLATVADDGYLIISECVVGGTTTALSILTGLGIAATGKVNSSHPECNHQQKWDVVQAGLRRWQQRQTEQQGVSPVGNLEPENVYPTSLTAKNSPSLLSSVDPLQLIAAVGDPMQIVAAGMTIGASRRCGVLLAGGTQMLAVYALIQALTALFSSKQPSLDWQPAQVVVGTTRWVAEDSTGDTIGLAQAIGDVPLLATGLNFATSRYSQLQAYEQGYVKEGVGAGGCAIAAHLYQGWNCSQLLQAIEALIESSCQ
ncbi:MAG TPA: TIGR00303 family protein, partial [Cyanophyceae cyanobacterium]